MPLEEDFWKRGSPFLWTPAHVPFPFADFTWYSLAVIHHSHEDSICWIVRVPQQIIESEADLGDLLHKAISIYKNSIKAFFFIQIFIGRGTEDRINSSIWSLRKQAQRRKATEWGFIAKMAELGLEFGFVCFHIPVPSIYDSSTVLLLKVGNYLPCFSLPFFPFPLTLVNLSGRSGST